MTPLSARYVKRPRKRYHCDTCGGVIAGPYIRLYGNADREPMWTLRLHPADPCCNAESRDPKVRAALAQAGAL